LAKQLMFIEQKENIVKDLWQAPVLMSIAASPKRTAGDSVGQPAKSVEPISMSRLLRRPDKAVVL
jgi:hypothetical protein